MVRFNPIHETQKDWCLMTKQDFIKVAEITKRLAKSSHTVDIVYIVATELKSAYPNFNKDKFIDYCLKGEK